ncbi:Putative DNA-binding protein in cluster with Type I restriction-modification system [uncultured Gammaproteobacteria bacterium]|jgi:prophage maintenance system killer protein|uniref:virulence protein RhuM/Fic/DOC family protein n=1 Tax=thiotrophic endosymbiont of Bathymodiolus puteoserpentis (Logatchev) TaxID=343240 RepID=UPI0010AFE893|nr:virulence protein RhuM/Fic/DOC family protein [thiotrophic endosymbiont of Bathymodiolus puteoserpentis (Logatchev)]CAC9501416.1 Putative DNA-binding protein in cluster with Type I restriction-modification system [uncultured Gammaproteobacteria bacterium]CAC9509370.1 Putative DNA-binding protein in cluster with Type I restriction-modification system [uncultured Gammaproteobacteria bacterium]CAC9573018.1 Putative DNA-binding protein in cluster with Type I restriction-modification system [uncul
MTQTNSKTLVIYQTKNGAIELKLDSNVETVWASQKDIVNIFDKDQSVISRHIKKILLDKEVDEKSNMQKMHITNSDKPVVYYSLDIILAVGYRTNSAKAIQFRQWTTRTLKQHITQGWTINSKRINKNYKAFINAVEDVKYLAKNKIDSDDVLELVKSFANTWFSLEAFDENKLPDCGVDKNQIKLRADSLYLAVDKFKQDLISKKQATNLFAQEKKKDSLAGIFANVFQSIFGDDAYPSIEGKAAHLLYFIVKNHPFNDGNKRTGAFTFIWFLNQAGFDYKQSITPQTLTTLTLLIATSNPNEKDKLIGLVLLLLNTENQQGN